MIRINDKLCEICDSNTKVTNYRNTNTYLCNKHRIQMDRYGEIRYSTYDKNILNIGSEFDEIVLKNRTGVVVGTAKIDKEETERCSGYKWSLNKDGYVISSKGGSNFYLHRYLIGASKGEYVDHINYDRLDNRKENLRICTNSQNLMHRSRLASNNTTGYHGIIFRKDRNKFRVEIQANKEKIFIGHYDKIDDAIAARIEAEIKYFGKYKSFFVEE